MADEQQSPTVEIAPTIIVSNSDEGAVNVETADSIENPNDGTGELSSPNIGEPSDIETPAVAVAEIEASRDVALAEIDASVERERIAAQSERNGDLEECQKEIQELRETVATLAEAIALLTPPPVSEVVEEQLEIAPETNLTPPSTAAPTLETMTEPLEESEEESQVEEIPERPARRFIAI